MGREIKFRAWNGMEMEYDVVVGLFGAFYVNPGAKGDGLDPNDAASLTPFNTLYSKQTPIMQFTGLKDKNGKEIYEGDIVRFLWNPVFNEPSAMPEFEYTRPVSYYEKWGCFVMTIFSTKGENQHVAVGSPTEAGGEIEVVGNIYENPELLESN